MGSQNPQEREAMKKSSVAVFILTAALAATAARAEDYYTFKSGEKIPLFDSSDAALSYVKLEQNAKRDGTEYEMAQENSGTAPRIVVNLNNSEAGDYIFYFKGSSKNAVATYTATIAGEDGTSYDMLTGAQAQTAGWSIDTYGTDHKLWLPSLPAGNFTLKFTVACSDGWKGHYGNFTFTKVDATLDLADNLGSNLDLGEKYTNDTDRFGSQKTEGWVSLVRSDGDHKRLLLADNGFTIDSTKHNDTVTFYLHINATAAYCLSYQAGSGVSIAWSLFNASTDAEVYTVSKDVTPNSDSKWTLSNEYSNFLGTLESGYYVLTATVKRSSNTSDWACNFGYFNFSKCIILPSSNPLDLSAAKGNGSLKLTGNSQLSEGGGNIENTKKDDTIKFFLYVPEYAKYAFAYKSGSKYASTVTWTLANADETAQNLDGSSRATDVVAAHNDFNLVDGHSHKTDILPPGFYTLTGVISDANGGWAGNFGDFSILRDAAYAKTTIGETTVYVEKDWLTAAYGSGTTTIPEGFSTVQTGNAISGAEAYALGYNSIPAAGAVVVSPSITGTTMTFGFKDADADAAVARGATITYTLKTGTAADSLSEGTSSTALPTLDLATGDSVKYIKLKADVSW